MKRILHVFLPVLAPVTLFAQDWSPMNTTEAFNFRLNTDAVITSTIHSVSYSANAGDTTFQLNTLMCDTCFTWTGGPLPCDTCYGLLNVAQFTGRTLVKTSPGWVNFRDPGSKTIHLHAALNDSWLFDTLANVTAQVIYAGPATVLGNADSLKTLLLSTGDTVKFSKAHGITQWPDGYGQNSYYRLEGIHGRDIGVLVPRMMDYFNFDVGDMFEYHGHLNGGMAPHMTDFKRKYTITGKTVSGDTVTYTTQGYWVEYCTDAINWNYWTNYGLINANMIFVDSARHTGNLFNFEPVDGEGRIYSNSGSGWLQTSMTPGEKYYRSMLFADTNNLKGVRFGITSDYTTLWVTPAHSASYAPGSDTLVPVQNWGDAFAIELTEGLGQVFGKYSSNFEGSWGERLMAYRKGNDTVGVFTPDNVLNGTVAENPAGGIHLFPNPASDAVTVQLPAGISNVSLIDLSGREVKTFGGLSGTVTLAIGDLADGIYLLHVASPSGASQQKIVIRR